MVDKRPIGYEAGKTYVKSPRLIIQCHFKVLGQKAPEIYKI